MATSLHRFFFIRGGENIVPGVVRPSDCLFFAENVVTENAIQRKLLKIIMQSEFLLLLIHQLHTNTLPDY